MKRYPIASHVKWNLSAVDYVSDAILEIMKHSIVTTSELPLIFNVNNPVETLPMDELIEWTKELHYEVYSMDYSTWQTRLNYLEKSNALTPLKEFFQNARAFPHSDAPSCSNLESLLIHSTCKPRGLTKSLFNKMVSQMQAQNILPLAKW